MAPQRPDVTACLLGWLGHCVEDEVLGIGHSEPKSTCMWGMSPPLLVVLVNATFSFRPTIETTVGICLKGTLQPKLQASAQAAGVVHQSERPDPSALQVAVSGSCRDEHPFWQLSKFWPLLAAAQPCWHAHISCVPA